MSLFRFIPLLMISWLLFFLLAVAQDAALQSKSQADVPDPSKAGSFEIKKIETALKGKDFTLDVHFYFPDDRDKRPFPVFLFSPGGDARPASLPHYATWASHLASHGYVVALIAFNGDTAPQRALRFGKVIDWLEEKNSSADWPLSKVLNLKKIILSGHSRGGIAALIAAAKDKRVRYCVGMEASYPEPKPEFSYKGRDGLATLLFCGDYKVIFDKKMLEQMLKNIPKVQVEKMRKQYQALLGKNMGQPGKQAADAHWQRVKTPRTLIQIARMNHQLQPDKSFQILTRQLTAWLNWKVKGEDSWKSFIDGEQAQAAKKNGEIVIIKHEEG